MIELRLLVRKVPRLRGIDDGFFQPPLPDMIEVYVLQYREWFPGCIPGSLEPQWVDVPMVRE